MTYTIKLIFYSFVLGTFLLSGAAFSANSTDEAEDLDDQPVKSSIVQPAAKTKGNVIKKSGGSNKNGAVKMPDDPFGKTKNEMTKMPPDPLERNKSESAMMPVDPLEKNTKTRMKPGDSFNKTKHGMTKRPPDPLEKNNNEAPMMPDELLN